MRAIIIDDEKRSADNLRMLLEENCPEVEIIAVCHDAEQSIATVNELVPDVLFLDIQMPFADGFTVRESVVSACPNVIFTTAFAEYAVKAIRAAACDYLLKPIDPEELRAAVQKVKKRMADSRSQKRDEPAEKRPSKVRPPKLAIQGVEGYSLVDYTDVIRLEASSNYTHIHCRNGQKHTVARLLRDYEEMLQEEGFFRSHSSHLVNLAHVVRYIRGDGGYLYMSDGTQIEVSRSRKKDLLRILLGEE
jgi:two-component system, LytTR family, response regulator